MLEERLNHVEELNRELKGLKARRINVVVTGKLMKTFKDEVFKESTVYFTTLSQTGSEKFYRLFN